MNFSPEDHPQGWRKVAAVLRHPRRYAGRALWKARHFKEAWRQVWTEAPPWFTACCRRRETLDYGPINIFLESSSGCNLHCPMCPTGLGRITRPHGLMKPELAAKLAAEIRHTPGQVGLWLGGEPLLNPALAEIVAILSRANLPVGIHTNATLLTGEKSRALMEAGLRFISFSFDGTDPESYARMRVGGTYARTLENILAFLRIKAERGGAGPEVTIQTVVPYEGDAVHPYGIQLTTPEGVKAVFAGLPVDHFRAIIANAWSGALDDSPLVTPNRAGEGSRIPCKVPYTDLTIAWNGDAVTCCGDLDASGVLGNLYRENLYELWNNERFRALRRAMHTREIESHPLCGHCERIWTLPPPRLDYRLRLELLRYQLRW